MTRWRLLRPVPRTDRPPVGRQRVLAASAVLALTLTASTAAAEKVLVWAVVPLSVDHTALANWARTDLEVKVRRFAGMQTVDREVVDGIVRTEYPDLVDCTAEVSCLAEIGVISGADLVIVGTLAKLGDAWAVTLRAVRTTQRTAVVSVTGPITGAEEALSARVGEILPPLLASPAVDAATAPGTGLWPVLTWSTAGAAVLTGAGAATAGLLTLRTRGRQEEVCPDRQCTTASALSRAEALRLDGRRERTWANALLVASGVLTSAAVTLFFLSPGGAP